MALAYFSGTVVQGGADAFAQAEIATSLSGQTQRAFRVREILFEFSSAGSPDLNDQQLALTRRTKTAIPRISDKDAIAVWKQVRRLSTNGATTVDLVRRLTFTEDDNLLIVEDPVFFQIDSTATTLTLSGWFRVGYELVTISAVDRLTLLTQSLD